MQADVVFNEGSDGARRRDFLNVAAVSFAAVGAGAALLPLVWQMAPSADVLAIASVEVDISKIGPGEAIKVLWRKQPVFIRQLTPQEIREGGARLERLVERLRPGVVVILGAGAYRTAFGRPRAAIGAQPEPLGGAPVWLVPNPSGLQARCGLEQIAALLRDAALAGRARRLS